MKFLIPLGNSERDKQLNSNWINAIIHNKRKKNYNNFIEYFSEKALYLHCQPRSHREASCANTKLFQSPRTKWPTRDKVLLHL